MANLKLREKKFKERYESYIQTLDCVHCGLCIPFCPTHGITGRESDSPRGRIYMMRGYAEETMPFTRESLKHLDQCIVCRQCESVCPSGIRMGDMMESFRYEMNNTLPQKGWRFHLSRFLLKHLVPYRRRIAFVTDILSLYDRLGIRRFLNRIVGRLGLSRLRELDDLFPNLPKLSERRLETDAHRPDGLYPAEGKTRMRVVLFLGCITSEWFAPTHRSTIRMLNRAGCDVIVPDAQTCCGALHRHAGFLKEAHELYERNASVFSEIEADVLVVNAAGCGAALKEPPESCPQGLGLPVRDICEFLDEVGIPKPDGEFAKKVAYDQPCHLVHGQQVPESAVTNLLKQVPGLDLVHLEDSDRCCGSGGVYNLVHPEMAAPILDEKVDAIVASGAEVVVTGNPGCAMQIASGLRNRECSIEVLHPLDLLDRVYSS